MCVQKSRITLVCPCFFFAQLQHGRDTNGLAEVAFNWLERIVAVGGRENSGDTLLDQSGRPRHFQHDH